MNHWCFWLGLAFEMMLADADQFRNLFSREIISEHQVRVQRIANIGDKFALAIVDARRHNGEPVRYQLR